VPRHSRFAVFDRPKGCAFLPRGAKTLTTIVTFLMVALLQNSQTRANQAVQDKLNAIADGLADLMTATADRSPHLHDEVAELRSAVGLEDRERS
jgi:hypothetical protein